MKQVLIDENGDLRCPVCGAKQMSYRRTRAAKLTIGLTAGVGALAAPKRSQCLGCKEYLKGPPIPIRMADDSPSDAAAPPRVSLPRTGSMPPLDLTPGDVPIRILDCEWLGPSMVSMLNGAWPGLPVDLRLQIRQELMARRPVEVGRLSPAAAVSMVGRLRERGFTVEDVEGAHIDNAPEAATTTPTAAGGITEQLRDLAELRREGLLSEEEFASAKARLLSSD